MSTGLCIAEDVFMHLWETGGLQEACVTNAWGKSAKMSQRSSEHSVTASLGKTMGQIEDAVLHGSV